MRYITTILLAVMLVFMSVAYVGADDDLCENPATLSVEPETVSGEEVKDTEEAEAAFPVDGPNDRVDAADASLFATARTTVEESIQQSPLVWGILGVFMAGLTLFFGKKGASALIESLSQHSSKTELAGIGVFLSGLFTIANAAALTFSWSYLITNLFLGGFVTMVVGLGLGIRANHEN